MIKLIARDLLFQPNLKEVHNWKIIAKEEYISFLVNWIFLKRLHLLNLLSVLKNENKTSFWIADPNGSKVVLDIDALKAELSNISKEYIESWANKKYIKKVEKEFFTKNVDLFLQKNYSVQTYRLFRDLIPLRFFKAYQILRLEKKCKEKKIISPELLERQLLKNNNSEEDLRYFKLLEKREIDAKEFTLNSFKVMYASIQEIMNRNAYTDHEAMELLIHEYYLF